MTKCDTNIYSSGNKDVCYQKNIEDDSLNVNSPLKYL